MSLFETEKLWTSKDNWEDLAGRDSTAELEALVAVMVGTLKAGKKFNIHLSDNTVWKSIEQRSQITELIEDANALRALQRKNPIPVG